MSNVAILEIRPGVGGDEAKIWAQDLARMYVKFAKKKDWQIKVLDQGVFKIKGKNAFNLLKNEAGVHRVQRIPETERHGRIHTSTATVAVLPQIPVNQVKIDPKDLDWQFYRASTQGGQNVQKVSTAVRLTHQPTGITVTCEQERYQKRNREIALQLLASKLWQREQEKKQKKVAKYRAKIGRAKRSEKIRTYNFHHNRVTDHRLGKSFHILAKILDGDLKKLIIAKPRKKA